MKHNKICKLLLLTAIFGMLTACGGGISSVVPSSQTSQQSQSEKSNPSVDPGSSTISISSIESSIVPSSKQEDILHGTLTYTGVGELRVDGTLNVVATYHWAEGDPIDLTKFSFSWIAGDPSVISLTPNKNKCDVKGLKTGSSSLKISFGNISTEATINVLDKYVAVESVTLSEHALNFTVGDGSKTLVATVLPENATVKNVTWSSSADNIASVNNGVVTPVAAGDAVITATCDGKSDTCTVCVVDQPTPTVYDYQAVINGVNIPLTKNESATGEHLDAEYQAKGVEVVLGQSVKFINKDGQELSEKFGAEPDSPTEYNNVINNEGAYTIRQSGTVDIYLKIWDTPWTNFWITGGGSIEPVKENWVARYYDASEQNWSDLALNLNETTGEYELEKIILEGDKFCIWNGINSQEESKWLHYSEVKYNDQLLVSADNDGNILVNDPAKYGIYVNVTENKIGLLNKSYSIKVDEETSNLSMKLDRTSEDPKTGTVEYTLTNVDLNAQKVLEFYKDGTKIDASSISIKNGANAYVEDGVIHVHNDFAAAEGKGIFLEKTSEGYALWVDGFEETEKWVIHFYDSSEDKWINIEMVQMDETTEYKIENQVFDEGDKFCIWNSIQNIEKSKWYHYNNVKYHDQLLVYSSDVDKNITFIDPAKYNVYFDIDSEKIGLFNVSYSLNLNDTLNNLSMKCNRTQDEPKQGNVEYCLTNQELKAGDILEFYKDGTKIDSSLIEIKDGANARKNDGIITVHGDFDATEGKGIFLEKTSEGYLLWVDSRETPHWYIHYFDATTQEWSDIKMNYEDDIFEYTMKFYVGDKVCFWNGMEGNKAQWLHADSLMSEMMIPFDQDSKNNIVCKYEGTYLFTIIAFEGVANPYIVDCSVEFTVGETEYKTVYVTYTQDRIEYYINNIENINEGTVVSFTKNGVAIPTSKITIEKGSNALIEDGVIKINNNASNVGIYLKTTNLEENFILWIDGFVQEEKWVAHYYDGIDQAWSDISLNLNETTGEYELEKNVSIGDKFCIWNSVESENEAKWFHYSEVKYEDQLLVSDDNGDILFNDPGKYKIFVNIKDKTIGLNNVSYSADVGGAVKNLSMQLNRTSYDPKKGHIEYKLDNVALTKDCILKFKVDGIDIPNEIISIKSQANAYIDNDGNIKVANDAVAKAGEGIFLERVNGGYELWVHGYIEVEKWVAHYYTASTTRWNNFALSLNEETGEYFLEKEIAEGDKVCIWNSMTGESTAKWLKFENVKYDDQLLVYSDGDGNFIFNEAAKYGIYVDVKKAEIGLNNLSYSISINEVTSDLSMKLVRTSVDPKTGTIEYTLTNADLNAQNVLEFYKDGAKIEVSSISIKNGANAYMEDGVIYVHNDFAAIEGKGIFLEKTSEGYALWVDGYVAPAEINYALHGKVNGSTVWKDFEMTQSTDIGKEAEYLLKDVVMKAGDEICFKYNGSTWYKYDHIKAGCLSLFSEAEKDNNIVINDDGVYNFYVGIDDGEGKFIWATRRDYVAFYLMDNEDKVQDTLIFDDKDNTYYSGLDLYGTTTEYYLWNGLTGEDSLIYYYDDIYEPCQQHLVAMGESEDKLFKFKLDGQYSFVISSDYKARVFNDSLYMKINGETTVKLDPGHTSTVTDTYWYAQFKEYDLDAGTKLEFFYCDTKIDPTTVTLEKDCNAVVEDGYFKLINDFVVEDNNIIKLTVNDGYSLKIDGTETPTVTTYGYTINDGVMHELTEGNANEWVAEDVVLTPNDTIAFYDCHEDTPVLIPVALETDSSSNFRISDDKLVSYWGGIFDLYLKLAYENDKVYVEGEVTIPAITYTLHYGDPIPVEFNDGQWSITEIELGANEVIELFADGEPYPFILESGCTVTGLDFDGSKATSTVDDSTFSFYVKKSGQTWINRNYPSVTIKLNVDTFIDWKKDNAWFAAYVYTNEAKDGHFEYLNSDLELKTTTQYSYFSFIRMIPNTNPSYDSSNGGLNWNNKWDQTPDQSFSLSDDGETYNVTGWKTGNWQS